MRSEETKNYALENGELVTFPDHPISAPTMTLNGTNGTCVKVVVYYEKYFLDGWVGPGNDPNARYKIYTNIMHL